MSIEDQLGALKAKLKGVGLPFSPTSLEYSVDEKWLKRIAKPPPQAIDKMEVHETDSGLNLVIGYVRNPVNPYLQTNFPLRELWLRLPGDYRLIVNFQKQTMNVDRTGKTTRPKIDRLARELGYNLHFEN